ncbi:MAG: Carbamoyl-phosphate synthase large chain [Pelotomaculum sp. PtaB.Bin104]|nr:MAG: Carbamoyl-phosphate synthase large chain [Pelotomaculum sp. PtaB.Bin104]
MPFGAAGEVGFTLYATRGTARTLEQAGLQVIPVKKIHESDGDNTQTIQESGKISYIISTSSKGRLPSRDSVA